MTMDRIKTESTSTHELWLCVDDNEHHIVVLTKGAKLEVARTIMRNAPMSLVEPTFYLHKLAYGSEIEPTSPAPDHFISSDEDDVDHH